MKLTYTTLNERIAVELEGSNHKEVFKQIGAFQEVFEECACRKCGGDDLRYVVRVHDDNEYYELRCQNIGCKAKLQFGAHKKGGGLFPRRKDAEGNWRGTDGWTVWNAQTGEEE